MQATPAQSKPLKITPGLVRTHAIRAHNITPPADFLLDYLVEDFVSRIHATQRQFEHVLDLLSPTNHLPTHLSKLPNTGNFFHGLPPGFERLSSYHQHAGHPPLRTVSVGQADLHPDTNAWHNGYPLSLVTSMLGLHWSNALPQWLNWIFHSLKTDGLFLAVLPTTGTLDELRQSLIQADLELLGGATPRVDPFIPVSQAGKLLQDSGFALPVADKISLTVNYDNLAALVQDLRAMGATCSLGRPQLRFHKTLFEHADMIYQQNFGLPNGRIPASFNFVFLTGWKPHESQQKPLRPGSAQHRLADFL